MSHSETFRTDPAGRVPPGKGRPPPGSESCVAFG